MQRRPSFIGAFLQGDAPSNELLAAFFMGLMMTAVAGNLLYDILVVGPRAVGWRGWVALGGVLALTALAYALYRIALQRMDHVTVDMRVSTPAAVHAGVVWTFGPGPFGHMVTALQHHLDGGGAQHCWLVMVDDEVIKDNYAKAVEELKDAPVQLHPHFVTQADMPSVYAAASTILAREVREEGLTVDDVVVDITGGTKPMTAGMVLAALTAGADLEYVDTVRTDTGAPEVKTARVVAVESTFARAMGRHASADAPATPTPRA